jgi:hypothetical protein
MLYSLSRIYIEIDQILNHSEQTHANRLVTTLASLQHAVYRVRWVAMGCCEVTIRSTKVGYLMYLGNSNGLLLMLILPCALLWRILNAAYIGVELYMEKKSTIKPKWLPIYIVQDYQSLAEVFYMCVRVIQNCGHSTQKCEYFTQYCVDITQSCGTSSQGCADCSQMCGESTQGETSPQNTCQALCVWDCFDIPLGHHLCDVNACPFPTRIILILWLVHTCKCHLLYDIQPRWSASGNPLPEVIEDHLIPLCLCLLAQTCMVDRWWECPQIERSVLVRPPGSLMSPFFLVTGGIAMFA